MFIVEGSRKIPLQCKYDENFSSVVSNYINKTNDTNVNYYLFNGQRLSESLTISQQGLKDGANIFVVWANNILGAF